jgi:hypothetical protein
MNTNLTKICYLWLALLLYPCVAYNQNNRFLNSRAEIVTHYLPENDIYFTLQVEKGTTINSLTSFFRVDPKVLLKINQWKPKATHVQSETVKVPIKHSSILSKPMAKDKEVGPYVQVYYQVKQCETMYHIAKKIFDTEVESLQKINKMSDNQVKVGQKLFIGYLHIYPASEPTLEKNKKDIKPTKHTIAKAEEKQTPVKTEKLKSCPTPKDKVEPKVVLTKKTTTTLDQSKPSPAAKNTKLNVTDKELKKDIEKQEEQKVTETEEIKKPEPKDKISNVVAMWDKTKSEGRSFFVLHNEAKLGSTMILSFPMTHRTVKAKVVGRIPDGTYTDDVMLFMSPAVANQLGVLDSKAKLQVHYALK